MARAADAAARSTKSRLSGPSIDPRRMWSNGAGAPRGLRLVGPAGTVRCRAPRGSAPNSGWASNWSRLGRGALRRISITRSVIATTSSTAPSVSLSSLRLAVRSVWRLSIRATSRARDLAPVGPVARRQAKDVAQAVVADVPALGEAGLDLAARIEPHQSLRDARQQHLLRRGERAVARDRPRSAARSPITATSSASSFALAAPADASASAGAAPTAISGSFARRAMRLVLSVMPGFIKHLDICARLFYMTKAVAPGAVVKGADERRRHGSGGATAAMSRICPIRSPRPRSIRRRGSARDEPARPAPPPSLALHPLRLFRRCCWSPCCG